MGVTTSGISGMPGPARGHASSSSPRWLDYVLQGVYKSVVGGSTADSVRGHGTSPPPPGARFFAEGDFVVYFKGENLDCR